MHKITHATKIKYIFIVSILLIGIISGSICGINAAKEDNTYFSDFISLYKLQGFSFDLSFLNAVWMNLRAIILIWISGWSIIFIPISLIQILSKGFALGYTISYLIFSEGLKGFLFAFALTFVQSLFFIPFLIILSVYEINSSLMFKNKKMPPKQNQALIKKKLLILFAVCVLGAILALIDTYITPVLIKTLCLNML